MLQINSVLTPARATAPNVPIHHQSCVRDHKYVTTLHAHRTRRRARVTQMTNGCSPSSAGKWRISLHVFPSGCQISLFIHWPGSPSHGKSASHLSTPLSLAAHLGGRRRLGSLWVCARRTGQQKHKDRPEEREADRHPLSHPARRRGSVPLPLDL